MSAIPPAKDGSPQNSSGKLALQGRQAFIRGLCDSLAIVLGYLPMAISFGIAAMQAGVAPWMAPILSIVMYAGAGQFVLVALLASGASAWAIVTTVMLVNVRHLFYGPALLPVLTQSGRRWPLPVLAAGLTDEVFATAMGYAQRIAPQQREPWYMGLQLGAYSAWVGGTIIGVVLGRQISQQAPWLQATLNFVLPALFFALMLELLAHSRWQVVVAAMLGTAALLWVLPSHWAMLGGMIIGGITGTVWLAPARNVA